LSSPNRIAAVADGHANIEAALAFADARHAGQKLGDDRPFLAHPLEVASQLHRVGAPEHLVIAGLLHDLVEKAGVSEAQLRRRFGAPVTRLVAAVTDDESITGYAKRKAALRQQVASAGDEALTLFAADKLSMLRELRREIKRDQDGNGALRARRLKHYQRSLAMLEERLPDSVLVRDLRRELRAFEHERSALSA
jgi:(p)ppGpp synthase/HD superfamily hydrolase